MTEQQFNKCVQNNIPIYKIWVKDKFHKQQCAYEYFRTHSAISWINTVIPYDTKLHCECMYVSGDKLEKGINKFFKYLQQEERRKIKEANKKLECLRRAKEEIK